MSAPLLNKIPVLDKGYVATISTHNSNTKLNLIKNEMGITDVDKLESIASLTVAVKCPLFVQLFFSQYDLKILNAKQDTLEAYIPSIRDIGANDLETSNAIADNMYKTTEALLLNPKAFQADGCDKFVAQSLMPLNVYTTLVVSGSVSTWRLILDRKGLPTAIDAYRIAIKQLFDVEWY